MVEEKPDNKDNTLDQVLSFLSHIYLFFHDPLVIEIRAIPQFFSLKGTAMEITPIPIKNLDVKIPMHKENVEN